MNSDPPSDHDFLEKLMVDSASPHLNGMRDLFEKIIGKAVEEQIAKGLIDPKDRQEYFDLQISGIDPARAFQGGELIRVKTKALECLRSERQAFEHVPVGALSVTELNAFAIRTPGGGAAVGLNMSLWAFLKIIDYCAIAMIFRKTPVAIGVHHTDNTYAQNILLVIEAIRSGGFIIASSEGKYSISDCVGPAAWPQKVVFSAMTTQLVFILLHEYGHIYHGHLNANLTRRVGSKGADIDVYLTSHRQEFEADEFAVRRLLHSMPDEGARQFCMMALSTLFLLFDACEEKKGEDSRLLGTHPASRDRLEKIRQISADVCGDDAWARIYETIVHVDHLFASLAGVSLDPETGYIMVRTSR
jgi:hypothetical protein